MSRESSVHPSFYSSYPCLLTCTHSLLHRWSTWNANCTAAIYESVYPEPIPPGTSVPSWAYLDVHQSDNFNVSAAQLNQQENHPESSAGGPSPTSGAGSPTGSGGSALNTALPASGSSSKHSNTGAIVGGVVGGIGGAAILAGIAFFFWGRHKRNVAGRSTTNADTSVLTPGVTFDGDQKSAAAQPYSNMSSVNMAAPVPVSSPGPAPGLNTAGVGAVYAPGRIYVSFGEYVFTLATHLTYHNIGSERPKYIPFRWS